MFEEGLKICYFCESASSDGHSFTFDGDEKEYIVCEKCFRLIYAISKESKYE